MNEVSVTVFMRTEVMDSILNEWYKNEEIKGITITKTNNITSEANIEEARYKPAKLIEILEKRNESYYILTDWWEEPPIPWDAQWSDDYQEKLKIDITPLLSLDIQNWE